MSKRVYLNKREGRLKEFAVIAVILLVVVIALLFVAGLAFSGSEEERHAYADSGITGERSDMPTRNPLGSVVWLPSEDDIRSIWSLIVDSPYVRSNPQYETVLRNTRIYYDVGDKDLNAYAAYEERNQVRRPIVKMLGGFVRHAASCGFARASDHLGVTTNALACLLMSMKDPSHCAIGEFQLAVKMAENSAAVREEAGQITAGMLMAALAHEAGHIAYGHVQHDAEFHKANIDVVRNEERDADSFASSIMVSSTYGRYMFESIALFHWFFAQFDEPEKAAYLDHPLHRERLENLIRSNERLALELGLSRLDADEEVK